MSARFWTTREVAILRRRYPHEPTADIARDLGRSLPATYNHALGMGLKKSAKYLASPAAHRIDPNNPASKAHRFAPGHATWNKGKHHKPPGSEKGWFKPGVLQGSALKRLQPIGHEKLDKDGLLLRKVSNNRSRYARWQPVHRIVWEKANGPVPRGFIVVFKAGRRTNKAAEITMDRLELITRAENMRRNSHYNRYPKEVSRLIQLRGALNRKINMRAQHEQHP